jgi:biopolymer transport protein ExbD
MAGKRRRSRGSSDSGEINMTAMIDVVFQLLVYFIVTIQPVDVVAHLDVFRPSPEKKQEKLEKPPKMINIQIFPDGFTINDRAVGLREMDTLIGRLAAIDTRQTIMIMATALSKHEDLIRVLDLCAKHGLQNLSVISTN